MSNSITNRDIQILAHIVRYCDEVQGTLVRFGMDYSLLEKDYVFRNALSKPIEEIGELVGHLSDGFKDSHREIPWRSIKGMRNWFAHRYHDMDYDVVWHTAVTDIPSVREACEKVLNEYRGA